MFLFAFLAVPAGLWRPALAHGAALLGTASAWLAAVGGLWTVLQQGPIPYMLGGWPRPLGIEYRLDGLSALLTTLVTGFGFIVVVYGRRQVDRQQGRLAAYYYALLLLFLAGLSGIVLTADVFNLFVFLEISSLSSYALIACGGRRGLMAAFRYLVLGTIAGSLYLLGIGFWLFETGTLNMAHLAELLPSLYGERSVALGLGLIVTGLSIKMALFPLHLWLPDAYAYAPPTFSPLIAAIGTKVSAYALMRLLFWVAGPAYTMGQLPVGHWLLGLGAAGIVIGSALAVPQRNLRRLLAMSSVGQVGYIAAGLGLGSPLGLVAAVLHIVNHAVAKACMFLAAGSIHAKLGTDRLSALSGIASGLPWTSAAAVVAGFSLIGVPPLGGFFSKWVLVQAAVEAGAWWLVAAIIVGSLIAVGYVFRVIRQLYRGPVVAAASPAATDRSELRAPVMAGGDNLREAPPAMLVPTVALALLTVVLGLGNAYLVVYILQHALPPGL
ncbi:MAG TPA: proton-conducting transporter membrane subunit [Bacillota bacterium]